MIATGDCFSGPGFDRWAGDYGVIYADAFLATVVLPAAAAPQGRVRTWVEAVHSVGLASLHPLHHNPAGPVTDPRDGWPINTRASKKAYLVEHGKQSLADAMGQALAQTVPAVLEQAQVQPTQVFVPRLEADTVDQLYAPALAPLVDAPVTTGSQQTGHLGAGDLLAHVRDIQELCAASGIPRTDLVVSAGAGFTVSAALVTTVPAGASW